MASKILKFARNINKPLVRFIIVNGWELRLFQRRIKGAKFKKLTKTQKREIKNYWKPYRRNINTNWVAYFSYANDIYDPRYIPESIFYGEIAPRLSSPSMMGLFHKNVQEQIFDAKQPKTIFKKTENTYIDGQYKQISLEKAIAACKAQGEVILKPAADTHGGDGIAFWSFDDGEEKLLKAIKSKEQLIVQEVVEQHQFLKSIHPSSLNTLRVVTLLVDGQAVFLSSIIRMGKNNMRVDNSSAGGIIAYIEKDGYLREEAIQSTQEKVKKHPDGFVFKGKKIPHFDKVVETALSQHYRIPYSKLAFWDFSIDTNGTPILIEVNVPGQIVSHQFNNGPLFGDYTDRVLDYVYNGKEL